MQHLLYSVHVKAWAYFTLLVFLLQSLSAIITGKLSVSYEELCMVSGGLIEREEKRQKMQEER